MASADNDSAEGPAPGSGGEGGDWTSWLRSRLERTAAPQRRQDAASGDEPQAAQDGAEDDTSPAPRLPPSEQEPGPDLGLRLQWPSHPLEPAAGARARAPDDRGEDPEAPGGGAQAGPASPEAPAARTEAPPARPDAPAQAPQAAGGERPAPTPVAARARHEATAVPPGSRALSGLSEPLATVPAHELVAGLDRLQSAVTSLSARVDGLADATITFRSVMNERMDEYTETVLRAAKASATDVQEYRRMHTASLAELRRNTNDTAESLRRLTGWMEELGSVQGDEERWATALSQALEQAAAERREDEQPVHQAVSTLLERLGRIEAGLGELAAQPVQPAEPAESPLPSALDDLPERLERIDGALDRLGRELAAEPPDPLLPVVTSLAERLERIERSLDELATEPGDPLAPPVVEALVERLERIERTVDGLGDGPGDHRPALDDEDVRAIAAAVADLLDARAPAAAGRPQTATTGPVAAGAAPAAPARGRRTAPIRAPSRGGSGR